MTKKVLLIDDEVEVLLDYVIDDLEERGYSVVRALSLVEALRKLKEHSNIKAAILDIMFPLSEEDDTVYERYFGRKPAEPADAMNAGGICQ